MPEKKYIGAGIEVHKREKEPVNSLIRRFGIRVKASGVLLTYRKKQYHTKDPNRIARRKSALVRAQDRKKYQAMRKLGKL